MKEILTQLFGDVVTDEAMKQFNAELGKRFVAKADFNAKVEEVKTLKGEKKTLEDEVAKLNENVNGNEDVKKELEALKAKIDADAKQAEAERISSYEVDFFFGSSFFLSLILLLFLSISISFSKHLIFSFKAFVSSSLPVAFATCCFWVLLLLGVLGFLNFFFSYFFFIFFIIIFIIIKIIILCRLI